MTNVPTYQGAGQPVMPDGIGLLARIGTFLGQGSAPAYVGDGQPSLRTSGLFAGAAPAYQQAPIAPQAVQNSHPSLRMTVALPHSGQRLPASTGADSAAVRAPSGSSSTPISLSG